MMARLVQIWRRIKDNWHEARCAGGVTFRTVGGGFIEYTCKRCGRVSVENPWNGEIR